MAFPLVAPFNPLNPPKSVVQITDHAPHVNFKPTLRNDTRYLLKCPAVRTKPIVIVGGGDLVVKGMTLNLDANVYEMLKITGGAPGRVVHFEDVWVNPLSHSGDCVHLITFAKQILQLKNVRIEMLHGKPILGGFKQVWMEDVVAHTNLGAMELGQQGTLSGSSHAVTGASVAGTKATLSIPGHTWAKGQFFQVSGINPVGFNGAWLIESVTSGHVTFTLGDVIPGAYVSGGSARQLVYSDPAGEIHTNRVQIIGATGAAVGFRFGARGASPFPNDYQTPITDKAWNGLLEATSGGLYITPPSGTPGDMWLSPSGAAAVWDTVQAHLAAPQVTYTWPKVLGHFTVGPHASGHEAVEIIGTKPVPQWTATPVAPTVSVSITGTAQSGQTLTAVEVVTGTPTPVRFRTWQKQLGTGSWQEFGGTDTTQLLSDAEIGWKVRVVPFVTNDAGSATVNSTATAVVVAGPLAPDFTSPPTLSGGGYVGGTLTVASGTYTGTEPITRSYQWVTGPPGTILQPIPGAIATTYAPTALDANQQLACVETLHGIIDVSESTAAIIVTATLIAATNVRLPGVTPLNGLPINPGDDLRGDDGSWAGTGPKTPTRKWYLDGTLIAGETAQTYHVRPTDVGHALAYGVAMTTVAGTSAEARSPNSPLVQGAVVTAPAPGVRLGCGVYDVMITSRGGREIRHHLERWTGVKFTHPVGDVGTASISMAGLSRQDLADCCDQLSDVLPWADEVAIYRRTDDLAGDLVWVGPVGDPTLTAATAEIPAQDLAAWFDVRLIHTDQDFSGTDVSDVAAHLVRDGMAPDQSPRLSIQQSTTGLWWSESVLESAYVTVGERLREMSAAGVRWYMSGRTFIVCGDPDPPLILTEAHFLSPPQVKLVGSSQATRVVITGQGVGEETAFVGDAGLGSDLYGLIERVQRTQATSSDAAQASADQWLAQVQDPIFVVESGVLSEDAPLRFADLAPGRRCTLSLDGLCYPIHGSYRLALVEVDTTHGEVITVHFIPA